MKDVENAAAILVQMRISQAQSPALYAALLAFLPGRARASRLRELALHGIAFEILAMRSAGAVGTPVPVPMAPTTSTVGASIDLTLMPTPGALAATLEWDLDQA